MATSDSLVPPIPGDGVLERMGPGLGTGVDVRMGTGTGRGTGVVVRMGTGRGPGVDVRMGTGRGTGTGTGVDVLLSATRLLGVEKEKQLVFIGDAPVEEEEE